jgi:hypothetical protein
MARVAQLESLWQHSITFAKRRPPNQASNSVALGGKLQDAKPVDAKGASFVALASTLLIAQKFREVAIELCFQKN